LAVLAAFSLMLFAASGQVAQQVTIPLAGLTIQDGVGVTRSSALLLPAAPAYSFLISGSVHGTGVLASAAPPGTSIVTALDTL
jgi:hypothetical protein